MTTFQETALFLTAIYIAIVVVRFRRSTVVLIGGLVAIGLYTLVALAYGEATLSEIGLGSHSWLPTIGFALVWLGLMLAYSPLADRLASRWFHKPPTLGTFRAIQESTAKLIAGIVGAWILGGFLEEVVFRGIVLQSLASLMSAWLAAPIAIAIAVCVAAFRRRPHASLPGPSSDGHSNSALSPVRRFVRTKWLQSLGGDPMPRDV